MSNCSADPNKSEFLSGSDEDEAVVSALSYSKLEVSKNERSRLDASRVSTNDH